MSKVGPYIVTRTLGQGMFGKVKLAKHQDTDVEYAIKILDKKDIKQHELTVNVRREIAIMKALNHRNIVNLREVLSSKNKLYIVMDLVRGGELFEMIEKRGELDEKTARKYFQQLVDGIEYCHRRGVFHRDLKPENLLLDENGVLKITDFGVSSVKKKEGDLLFTACGTPNYCAPEILVNTPEGYNGEKVDSWSCGVILYLLLVGELPFSHEETSILYDMIKTCKVKYPTSLSPGAKDLLMKMLVRDPNKRFTLTDVKVHPWFRTDYEGDMEEDVRSIKSQNKNRLGGSDFGSDGLAAQRGSLDTLNSQVPSTGSDRQEVNLGNSRQSSQCRDSMATMNNGFSGNSIHSQEEEQQLYQLEQMRLGSRGGGGSVGGVRGNNFQSHPGLPLAASADHGDPQGASFHSTGSVQHVQMVDLVPKYVGKDMIDFVRDTLPGKPEAKLQAVVEKLSEIDIDCVEDVQAVAETTATADSFRKWLEEQSSLPAVTSMRFAKMFFPHAVQ